VVHLGSILSWTQLRSGLNQGGNLEVLVHVEPDIAKEFHPRLRHGQACGDVVGGHARVVGLRCPDGGVGHVVRIAVGEIGRGGNVVTRRAVTVDAIERVSYCIGWRSRTLQAQNRPCRIDGQRRALIP
jgi:hypothetical protein